MRLGHNHININASSEKVFELIETMPNKFPVYKILETRPIFFLRLLFTDGFSTASRVWNFNKPVDLYVLKVGDTMGPFRLTEVRKPLKYWFSVDSYFINCETGYSLNADGNTTKLNFDVTAEKLQLKEKVYWFLVKPIHRTLARKVLKVIKEKAERE